MEIMKEAKEVRRVLYSFYAESKAYQSFPETKQADKDFDAYLKQVMGGTDEFFRVDELAGRCNLCYEEQGFYNGFRAGMAFMLLDGEVNR